MAECIRATCLAGSGRRRRRPREPAQLVNLCHGHSIPTPTPTSIFFFLAHPSAFFPNIYIYFFFVGSHMDMTMTYGREAMGELGPEDSFLSSHFKTLIHMCKLKGAPVPGPTNAMHWDKRGDSFLKESHSLRSSSLRWNYILFLKSRKYLQILIIL